MTHAERATSARALRIAVIAPLRYAIREPHAGGLESSVWHQIDQLKKGGHDIVLCAVEGSDFMADSPREFVMPPAIWLDDEEANDVDYPLGYLDMALPALDSALDYLQSHADEFDIVHNHSLHGLPLQRAAGLSIPMVSTLHTPVLPELVRAQQRGAPGGSRFMAVSSFTAREWQGAGISSSVLPNAVDDTRWPLGPGGDDLVWFGRIVREKGPHLAIETARLLGRRLILAGRVGDAAYAAERIWPELGPDVVYVGDLRHDQLADLVGRSACALVTPVWQEPFGLIIVEALMTGTPVASFDSGGISEVIADLVGTALAPLGDCVALAAAAQNVIDQTRAVPEMRATIRNAAVSKFSLTTRVNELEALYRGIIATHRERRSAESEPAA